ncbi:hypothetical protein [Legionella maceachernii]|uniref:Uncharacterized protein n=1 Tax=Legionella maceachernii TaxID=466 RepID=A0A0W0WGH4_9GAMM|nr:hypothetical protein [Legionella maceachernii]KTD31413.1 hypothetical protein Lmac_0288 [Legionella maceachernii]SKA23203.1 hypothetical protein SAMN02745128_02699 [Legionella maceachernii]
MGIIDIPNTEMEQEIVLMGESDDNFEKNWVKKRELKGATIASLNETGFPNNLRNPSCLTKVGHSAWEDMAMSGFRDDEDAPIVKRVNEALIQFPSIKRINLYSCLSGVLPQSCERLKLRDRIKDQADEAIKKLSYAEHFILALQKAFLESETDFPKDLCVVACLGLVKHNNGRAGISRGKRLIPQEKYTEIDPISFFVNINCAQFLATYQQHSTQTTKSNSYSCSPKATFFASASSTTTMQENQDFTTLDTQSQLETPKKRTRPFFAKMTNPYTVLTGEPNSNFPTH